MMKKIIFKLILPFSLLIVFNILYIVIVDKCAEASARGANISYGSPKKQIEDNGRMRNYIYKDTLKENLIINVPILIVIDSTVITIIIKKYMKRNII